MWRSSLLFSRESYSHNKRSRANLLFILVEPTGHVKDTHQIQKQNQTIYMYIPMWVLCGVVVVPCVHMRNAHEWILVIVCAALAFAILQPATNQHTPHTSTLKPIHIQVQARCSFSNVEINRITLSIYIYIAVVFINSYDLLYAIENNFHSSIHLVHSLWLAFALSQCCSHNEKRPAPLAVWLIIRKAYSIRADNRNMWFSLDLFGTLLRYTILYTVLYRAVHVRVIHVVCGW